jgi:hypothetical protein
VKKVDAQKTRRKEIEIGIYEEERKVDREVRMTSILGKLEKARMTIIWGQREYNKSITTIKIINDISIDYSH